MKKRHVFCISDGTGITAQTFGNSLLSQFDKIEFIQTTLPYIDDADKAHAVVEQINAICAKEGHAPLVFTTIVKTELAEIIHSSQGEIFDFFNSFIGPLEQALGTESSHTIGRTHSMADYNTYKKRIDALNFALNTDDGACTHQYNQADIILVGVSRCGKTPTSLYLALHYGIFVANYPLTEEDLEHHCLPKSLVAHKHKLFGLTINLDRLMTIRSERKPDSRYCSKQQCLNEIKTVEKLFKQERMPFLNSTHLSIEELATKIKAATER